MKRGRTGRRPRKPGLQAFENRCLGYIFCLKTNIISFSMDGQSRLFSHRNSMKTATLIAGVPNASAALYREIRFSAGDPAALLLLPRPEDAAPERFLLIRDIEMDRARRQARADRVGCPADFAPKKGLSGDREIATAQAVAECCRRAGIQRVVIDRSTPFLYAALLSEAGIPVEIDTLLGILDRRRKDAEEIAWIRQAQAVTENAIRLACSTIARAGVAADGTLLFDDKPLSSEAVKRMIDIFLLENDYRNFGSIVAGGKQAGDCHEAGSGPLRTGEAVIVDIYPQNRKTRYCGDCTRTVVHGDIPAEIAKMHAAVVSAKKAATATIRAGVSGETVHRATIAAMEAAGYGYRAPSQASPGASSELLAQPDIWLTHGTGHGLGLEIHEPPLLDFNGPELLVGDVVSVEPGLYGHEVGGVRVEDMVVVTETGCENLGAPLPEGLDWREF